MTLFERIQENIMARIAADVVLLPDEAMTDKAIEINRQIIREDSAELVLSREDCLPHISLAMGGIEERQIDAIARVLERIAEETHVRQLTATGIHIPTNSKGKETALLEIERTAALQGLHERVLEEMKPFFSHDVTDGMFYDPHVTDTSVEWVRTYPQKAGYERFSPHITLGYGRAAPAFAFPIPFQAAKLAICHLGNHCTCRKVVREWNVGMLE
jgi:2'-5' RNA ligase